jgi:hypothetical protein
MSWMVLTSSDKDDLPGKVWDVLVGTEMEIRHDASMM